MLFCAGGKDELFISSADWMTRNLDYRIEVGTQILDPDLKERIKNILLIQERDNRKARILDEKQQNVYVAKSKNEAPLRSQIAIRNYLEEVEKDLLKEMLAKKA